MLRCMRFAANEGRVPALVRAIRFGTLIVDNATSHPDEMAEFRAYVDQCSELDSIVLPIGKGQLIVRRRSDDGS